MKHRHILLIPVLLQISACSQHELFDNKLIEQPKMTQVTQAEKLLKSLPAAKSPTVVSVYNFDDQTGQLKPNGQFAEYSRAVTQGGLAILNKALLSAGNESWFTVVERGGLKNLLEERQIINVMRQEYATPNGSSLGKLPPLLYAGMLIEGGIVGYDSNIVTGGAGANYLGIGGNVSHQRDIVTIDLRAVSIANGQVILSVSSEKTIYSTGVQGNVFKYVSLDHLLEAETGFTTNEPPQLAVRQAIDTAVYQLIMEGARKGVWQFADPVAGQTAMDDYLKRIEAGAHSSPAPTLAEPVSQMPPASTPIANTDMQNKSEKEAIIENPRKKFASPDDSANANSQPQQYPPVLPPPPNKR